MSIGEIKPIILAGGSGTRLWPLSRKANPKQFLPVFADAPEQKRSLFQRTVQRIEPIASPPIVVCNDAYRFTVAEQLHDIVCPHSGIILEPCARNTAAAIALAALCASDSSADPLLLVLPSDHHIEDADAFREAVLAAAASTRTGQLVTFGIKPKYAATAYGYIKADPNTSEPFEVIEFIEKPEHEKAQAMLDEGNYLWNSGMFMFRASTLLEELRAYAADIVLHCERAWQNHYRDLDFIRVAAEDFEQLPNVAIDIALMEKTKNAVVAPLEVGWSDVGSWQSFSQLFEKDAAGNTANTNFVSIDASDNLVFTTDRLVTLVGVNQSIVVDTADALLVAPIDQSEQVKHLVTKLEQNGRKEVERSLTEYRPWGRYEELDSSRRYRVRRVSLRPQSQLSEQSHAQRSEHWVVVQGKATVTIDGETETISQDQSINIPSGAKHLLSNREDEELHLIEVQTGNYLAEDDVVRFTESIDTSDDQQL